MTKTPADRHLNTLRTRKTAVCSVKFTHRNLLQAGGGTILTEVSS